MSDKKILVFFLILIMLFMLGAGVWIVMHEKAQNRNIVALVAENEELNRRIDSLKAAAEELSRRDERDEQEEEEPVIWGDGYNWMAIGNSLTWISAWQRGICSTLPDNDYFGIVKAWLEERYGPVQAERFNYVDWEQSTLKSTMFDLIAPYLSEKLDLVTIQLGENVPILDTYGEDLELLIRYVRENCPSAQIIVIDDFWSDEKSKIRRTAAAETGAAFADLGEIRAKKEYQSREGTECLLADGRVITVNKEAESHPGDAGMAYIAEQIIKCME